MTEPGLAAPPTPRAAGPAPQRHATRWMQRLEEETAKREERAPASPAVASPGGTAAAQEPIAEAPETEVDGSGPAGVGAGILSVLGLIWLTATMWTAHASIIGNAGNTAVALGSAAAALPGVIAASLLAGATAGLLATGRFAADPASTVRRLLVGLAAGVALGVISAAVILFGYGVNSSIALLAITVGAGSALGGAAAATPRPVFAASLVATFGVFVIGVVFNVAQPRLTELFGAGTTVSSQANASQLFAYVQSGVSGIVAGLLAYWFLRRHGSRAWPWYLLAGALPGMLLLLTEVLTHLGGASLLGIVKSFSDGDRALVEFTDFARLRNGMVVLFVGGIASMIAVGRTLRATED